jgi:DNA-directed RNA polymerase specialized sigma subunit
MGKVNQTAEDNQLPKVCQIPKETQVGRANQRRSDVELIKNLYLMSGIPDHDFAKLTEHLKVLNSLARSLHKQTGWDFHDLFSEGCYQYLLARRRFNPEKGVKFTTFIWNTVRNSLLNYIRMSSKVVTVIEDDPKPVIKRPLKDVFVYDAY